MADYIQSLLQARNQANLANTQREGEIRSIYDAILSGLTKDSAFYKGGIADIEREKSKGIGQTYQQLISSGMFGTTTAANVPQTWERDYAGPQRLKLEDIMEQRRTSAQLGKAGFIERIQDIGPSLTDIFSMAQAGQSAGQSRTPQRVYGRSYGASSFKGSGLLYPTRI